MFIIAQIVLALALVIYLVACEPVNHFLGLEDDNFIEEFIEDEIQNETGLDVDLTPSSPEK